MSLHSKNKLYAYIVIIAFFLRLESFTKLAYSIILASNNYNEKTS